MNNRTPTTVAYIDGANLHTGVSQLGWELDYYRFRMYLTERYHVITAKLFMGYIPQNEGLYRDLRKAGYRLVFKEVSRGSDGSIKGNCDTDLAVNVMADLYENCFDRAVLVSGDGDFMSLIWFAAARGRLAGVVVPNRRRCSHLVKQAPVNRTFLDSLRSKLERTSLASNFGTFGLTWPNN